MTAVKKLLVLFCTLALVTVACGFNVDLGSLSPSSTPKNQPASMDPVSTMVAQTLQALTQDAPTNTPTPTLDATATPNNTPDPPTLSVSLATDCYAGPSTNYGFVSIIRPGTIVTIIGKDTIDNYWIIDVPGYPGTTCWLSGQYASVSGDTSDLPAPATPQPPSYTLNTSGSCYRPAHWPWHGGSGHWSWHGGSGTPWPTPSSGTHWPQWHGGGRGGGWWRYGCP
jgi:hypothetical protein